MIIIIMMIKVLDALFIVYKLTCYNLQKLIKSNLQKLIKRNLYLLF